MINTSLLYRQEIRQNTKTSITAKIILADNTELDIDGNRFILGSTSFDESTSALDEFEIGAAITKKFTTVLNNYDGYFDEYDFGGSRIIPIITKELSDGTTEFIRKGTYYIDKPDAYGNNISIKADDKMYLFDTDFKNVNITYPATLLQILNAVCVYCGVVLETQDFPNSDYQVIEPIKTDGVTCRDVVSSIAQLACCYARFANTDYLQLKWYETYTTENIDGGSFNGTRTPYIDGYSADGGTFAYNDGDSLDGGYFTDKAPYQIYAFNSFSVNTDDVVITGIKAIKDDASYLHGTEDYCLEIENLFFTTGNLEYFAKSIGNQILGLRFRPFSVSALGDASVEAGDRVVLIKNGQNYFSYATHITYKMSGYETYECGARSAMRNKSDFYSATTKKLLENQEAIKTEKSARELAVEQLAYQLANANGLYMTTDVQPDGSTIYYMHNKPTLAESLIVWKMTSTALGISTDGGRTYPYGLDVSGNAILNRIYAIGINADYIQGGKFKVGGENNVNGEIYIYNADGQVCGVINNSGIATFSQVTNRRVIINPDLGLVQTDSEGNDFYGLTYSYDFHLPEYAEYKKIIRNSSKNYSYLLHAILNEYKTEYRGSGSPAYDPTNVYFYGKFTYYYEIVKSARWEQNATIPKGDTTVVIQLPEVYKGKNFEITIVQNGITSDGSEKKQLIMYDTVNMPDLYNKADGTRWTDTAYAQSTNLGFSPVIGKDYSDSWAVDILETSVPLFLPYGNMYNTALNYKGTKVENLPIPPDDEYEETISFELESNDTVITFVKDIENATVTVTGHCNSVEGYSINELLDLKLIAVC